MSVQHLNHIDDLALLTGPSESVSVSGSVARPPPWRNGSWLDWAEDGLGCNGINILRSTLDTRRPRTQSPRAEEKGWSGSHIFRQWFLALIGSQCTSYGVTTTANAHPSSETSLRRVNGKFIKGVRQSSGRPLIKIFQLIDPQLQSKD